MLRRLPAAALEALLATFNLLWETGTFPAAWREATVVPILKPGKSGLDPLHYRPISLTSSFCKLMEKMVNVRLSWYLEHGILTNAQCGFRKHRSAVDHILVLDTEVRASFAQKKHLGALFDIEAAYDTVLRPVILRKLFKYGIRGCMGFFIENFLSRRSFRVRVGNEFSSIFVQENGVPQGGVLSVALFAVVINDIGDELPAAVGRSLFVDDLAIWYAATSPRLMSRQLQLAVTRLERWSRDNGLRFSTAKTVAVHFCRRRCHDTRLGIRLYGQTIPTQSGAKFLGVLFDRRLTYKEHFNPRTPGGFGRTPTPGGGGVDFRPPPLRSRKLRRLEKNGKRRLVDWEKHYKKHSDNFSLKSKLRSPEVIKGKIFPNFRIT